MGKKNKPEVFDTETFIAKSKRMFGEDKFDYSKVEYIKAKIKVKLRCIKHDHWFETTPDAHNRVERRSQRQFGGCPECRREVLGQYHRLSKEKFIEKSSQVHNNKYSYEKVHDFKNCHTDVIISCPEHGDFPQTVTNHLHNAFGCGQCAATDRGLRGRLTQEEVITRFMNQHQDLYDYSQVVYDGIYSPVKIYCKEHDHWFLQKPCDHFTGVGCRQCVHKGYDILKSGYFYINKVGDSGAIKVGITNVCPIERSKVLSRKSVYDVVNIFYFYDEDGEFILNLETKILSSFEFGIIPREDMRSGYTETTYDYNLPEIIDTVVYFFNNRKELKGEL